MNSSEKIKNFILNNLTKHEKNIVQVAISKFGVSRQAVHRHMTSLIDQKKIIAHGYTKGRYYKLIPVVNFNKTIDTKSAGQTHEIPRKFILPHLKTLKANIFEIFEFSVGALINNIFDHAHASRIYFKIYINHEKIHFIISDNGVGIFENIRSGLNLTDIHLATLELAKGKITIDPKYHTGDELNTIIHLFDSISIEANGKSLIHTNHNNDWKILKSPMQKGTRIHLEISPASNRTCAEVFNRIFEIEEKRISIPINLLDIADYRVINSRSQAGNVLRNIQNFKKIEFDFNQIDLIGPAFADELVRKARQKNKSADIKWINTNKTVDLLLTRALGKHS